MPVISEQKLGYALETLKTGIRDGAMPGATVCVIAGGNFVLHEALGTLDGTRETPLDAIYDLASITKPVATASSVLTLVERGQLLLSQPITDFFGDAAAHLSRVTVLHLLTHTSGLVPWIPCYKNGPGHDSAVAAILKTVTAEAGTKYAYSCLNFILLHKIVEIASGQALDIFARENVFVPLGMSDTGYRPDPSLQDRVAPTTGREGAEGANVALCGTVHDGNARAIGGVSGNAGLFGTAKDVATFGRSLLDGEKSLFGGPSRARILSSQITNPAVGAHSLFFFAHGNGMCPTGDLLGAQACGHSGFTGTVLTVDPETDLVAVVLTNSVYGEGKGQWLRVRRRFFNALAGALP